ncbi:hypothetical protein, partial [Klebsiella pneumoniae]|uniref:hypothetical protein n=1 Tax=Klebsiella pneumoniae TaxID=573 RepID=UPI003B982B09
QYISYGANGEQSKGEGEHGELTFGKCLQMLMRAWHLQTFSSLFLSYSPRGRCTGHKRQCGGFLFVRKG